MRVKLSGLNADLFKYKLKLLLKYAGISQRALSARLGVGVIAVGRWCRGEGHPRDHGVIDAIAREFGIPSEVIDPTASAVIEPFVLIGSTAEDWRRLSLALPGCDREPIYIDRDTEDAVKVPATAPAPSLPPALQAILQKASMVGTDLMLAEDDDAAPAVVRGELMIIEPCKAVRQSGVYRLKGPSGVEVVRRVEIRLTGPVVVTTSGAESLDGVTVTGRVARVIALREV